MSAFTIPSIFTAVDKYTAPLKKMTAATQGFTQKAGASVDRLDRRLNKLTPSFGALGKQMLAFASVGVLISGIGSAITTVKDYEQANADLAAVMNTSIKNRQKLSSDAERLGAITAKSASEVVGLQEAFARLGFETPEIINMTEATISGSIAMNAELAETAELTGAMVKTFDDFSSIDAPDILDKMTLSTQKSALNFEKLQTALPIVGGAANAAGISFENTLALLGKLSDAGIDASSSSTALRNIFLDSAKKGHTYTEVLANIEKNQDKLTAANDEFGKRGAVSASILAQNLEEISGLTNQLTDEFKGTAKAAADTRLDTFGGALTLLSSAYESLLIKINEGSGALSIFKDIINFLAKNLETIATVIGVFIGSFLTLKAVVLASKGALLAYNAISKLVFLVNTVKYIAATQGLTFAQAALAVAQTSLNAIMAANPIGLMVLGIAALIAGVVLVINYWDSWGASLTSVATIAVSFFSKIFFWVGIIISIVQSFRRNWDMITEAFTNGGIIDGLLAIGATLLDVVLYPLQQILEIAEKFTGLSLGSSSISDFRSSLGIDVGGEDTDEQGTELLNPKASEQKGIVDKIIESKESNVNVNINDPSGRATVESDSPPVGVSLSSTTSL